ncbi:sirohydrochlorin chelatase [Streptantibioticus rubrisoli]|uniref:Sirohydrochlorin chelatase n=1 Tax=Streptantibioticus rubrisoli TaxID=1387313 RepID=A0ABT1PCY6_9ACTN|nr:CbiX/SirB N-terminal domain-containing protein [Streptantibioticus rubrisoli]MCQ4043199.1 sirohydrochlorin chelatase [Streptantibioticus rubrisoli]
MAPVLLVIAHGSRDPRHAATVHALCERVRASRPALRVETGFLEHCAPRVPQVIERLAAEGVREVVALPLLLTRAFHAKTDIPAVLREAAARHVGVAVRQADVLGPSPLLTAAMERRLAEAGVGGAERGSTGLVLASAGSSDPEARTLIAGIAREWERTGWAAVRPADPSSTSDAVAELRAGGVPRVAVVPYVLAPGVLPDRIDRGAADADALASVLGDAPEVARLVLRRYAACAGGFSAVRQVA